MMFSDLPPELESEILSRVPATSLVRLQTTCKRWYALFKDSEFVEKNLVRGKAETKVILKQHCMDFSVSINIHGIRKRFDPYIEFICKLKSLSLKDSGHGLTSSERDDISEIFHCNGLLLCTTMYNRFAIWNPCTGQIRWIQTKPTTYPRFHKYFLGYENNNKSSHSYKILSFNNYYNGEDLPVTEFEIYEFNTDSWRVLDVITHDWVIDSCGSNGVNLKGNTYCFAANIEEPQVTFVLKFDFTTERFERLSLPFQCERDDEDMVVFSVIREEKLALLGFDDIESSSVMKIWVTNTDTDEAKDLSWSIFLVVDLDKFETYFGDFMREMSFLVDEENKIFVYCDEDTHDKHRTKVYIVGEDIYKQVYRGTEEGSPTSHHNPLLVSYVPSLVHIPASQSNSHGKRKR